MKQKRSILTILFLVVALVVLTSAGNKEVKDTDETSKNNQSTYSFEKSDALPDLQGKTIHAVTENAFVPLNFVDPKTGEAVGLEYDLTNAIAYLLNAKIDWNVTSWDTLINSVKENQFDVGMDGITINDERKTQVDFSDPYVHAEQVAVVRANEDRFTTIQEFAANEDLLIGSQAGTTLFYTAVYDILDGDESNPRIKLLENFALITQSLIAGDVDLIIMDKVAADGYIGASKNKVKIIDKSIKSEDFGYIFTKGSEYVQPFNQAIQYLKDVGYIDELNKKWFEDYKAE